MLLLAPFLMSEVVMDSREMLQLKVLSWPLTGGMKAGEEGADCIIQASKSQL